MSVLEPLCDLHDALGAYFGPAPLNEDAIVKRKRREPDVYLKPPTAWDVTGMDRLQQAVRGNLIQQIIESTRAKQERLKLKKEPSGLVPHETETPEEIVRRLEKLPIDELLGMAGGKIDWLKISTIDFEGYRSEASCELMWRNMVRKGNVPWTEQDDSRLLELVRTHGIRDWDTVADLVGKDRTPLQCAERYHENFHSKIKCGKFSQEEDEHLLLLVTQFRDGDEIPWPKVADHMEGRTRNQVFRRWETALDPMIRRGRWTKEEDTLLVAAVEAHGQHWVRISDFVPGRSANQCRDRYMSAFAGNVTFGHWSPEEDCKLIELVKKYGPGKWAQISEEMACRTRNMVLMRYKRLQKNFKCNDPESLEQLVKGRQWKGRKTQRTSETRKMDIVSEVDSAMQQEVGEGVSSKRKCSLLYESLLQKRFTASSGDEEPTPVRANATKRKRVTRRPPSRAPASTASTSAACPTEEESLDGVN